MRASSVAFRPDIDRYWQAALIGAWGLGSFGGGFAYGHPLLGAALLAGAGVLAWRWHRDGARRGHGFAVESAAVVALRAQCERRGWRLQTDLVIPRLGNLDAVVTAASMVFVLEIKSYWGLQVRGGQVVRCNREGTSAERELRQAQDQAVALRGSVPSSMPIMPVLWCPQAPREAGVVHDGVLLANGRVDLLSEAMSEMESRLRAGVGRGQ